MMLAAFGGVDNSGLVSHKGKTPLLLFQMRPNILIGHASPIRGGRRDFI